MRSVIEQLGAIETACRAARASVQTPEVQADLASVARAAATAATAFSGSWIGYHATVYLQGLRAPRPGELFDREWGLMKRANSATKGDWVRFDPDKMEAELLVRSAVTEERLKDIGRLCIASRASFTSSQRELLAILDALVSHGHREPVRETRSTVAKLTSHQTVQELMSEYASRKHVTRDHVAHAGGLNVPAHARLQYRIASLRSHGASLDTLETAARGVRRYLEVRESFGAISVPAQAANVLSQSSPNAAAGANNMQNEQQATQIFVSHSSADVRLASALVNLIDGVLGVPTGTMRCTSVPGYKLEPGADGPGELRRNLGEARIVVGLLTESSISSSYVLMELGAAWGLGTWIVPMLGVGVQFAAIPGPIGQGVHAIKCDDAGAVELLLETISKRTGFSPRCAADRRHSLVTAFVENAAGVNPMPLRRLRIRPPNAEREDPRPGGRCGRSRQRSQWFCPRRCANQTGSAWRANPARDAAAPAQASLPLVLAFFPPSTTASRSYAAGPSCWRASGEALLRARQHSGRDPCSRPYAPDNSDVRAACTQGVTGSWQFRYHDGSTLPSHAKCAGTLSSNVKLGPDSDLPIQYFLQTVARR